MARPSNRERILDSFETLVVSGGISNVTLDAVAKHAKVSKGGLLYHFPSKQSLMEGFGERLHQRVDALVSDAPSDPAEIVRWYLAYEIQGPEEATTFNSLLAALHANDTGSDGLIRSALERLYEPLEALDPYLGSVVQVVGNGLYLSALLGLPGPPSEMVAELVEELAQRAID